MDVIVKALFIALGVILLVFVGSIALILIHEGGTDYYLLDYLPSSQLYDLARNGYNGYVIVARVEDILRDNVSSITMPEQVLNHTEIMVFSMITSSVSYGNMSFIGLSYGDRGLYDLMINSSIATDLRRALENAAYEEIGGYRIWIWNQTDWYMGYTISVFGTTVDGDVVAYVYGNLWVNNIDRAKEVLISFMKSAREHTGWRSRSSEVDVLVKKIPIEHRSRSYGFVVLSNGDLCIGYTSHMESPQTIYGDTYVVATKQANIDRVINVFSLSEYYVNKTIVNSTDNYVLYKLSITKPIVTTQAVLEIQDALLATVYINDTHAIIYLQIKIKNVGDQLVTIKNVTVDGELPEEVANIQNVQLRPGEIFSTTIKVKDINPEVDAGWEPGTEHLVTVYYSTPTVTGQSVSLKVIAR